MALPTFLNDLNPATMSEERKRQLRVMHPTQDQIYSANVADTPWGYRDAGGTYHPGKLEYAVSRFGKWAGDRGNEALETLGIKPRPFGAGLQDLNLDLGRNLAAGEANAEAVNGLRALQGRAAPQVGGFTLNAAPQLQARGQQAQLANLLAAQAQGAGPSAAGAQFQGETEGGLANALMASRGAGAAGLNAAAMSQGRLGSQAAMQSAGTRLGEQQMANNMAGQVLAGGRGQDLGFAINQASLDQQAGLANQQAALQQNANNQAMQRYYLDTQADLGSEEGKRRLALEQYNNNLRLQTALTRYGGMNSAAETAGNLASGIGQGLAAWYAGSKKKED